jgi:hypothetical protein
MVLPLSEGHLEFTYNCFKEMETIGVNAAICCIGYGTQLAEFGYLS